MQEDQVGGRCRHSDERLGEVVGEPGQEEMSCLYKLYINTYKFINS